MVRSLDGHLHLSLGVLEVAVLLLARGLQGLELVRERLDLLLQGHALVRELDAARGEVGDVRRALGDDVLGRLFVF